MRGLLYTADLGLHHKEERACFLQVLQASHWQGKSLSSHMTTYLPLKDAMLTQTGASRLRLM
jgi:hypothetical protein